jgi:hypothetical protein
VIPEHDVELQSHPRQRLPDVAIGCEVIRCSGRTELTVRDCSKSERLSLIIRADNTANPTTSAASRTENWSWDISSIRS